ncbi:ABC transporter ATP-binding protein [Gulosibacter molinativorax]|uniref:ABC transporter ATP-binding protein n=1 Tax=Gulosibacter molinativorax TaxID=256821 RepID=A0ABT7C7Y8_9MICO|nr:ABC transporter ATP-binding protein [Gulosibacter molinativorax]MDJ1371336.1 ABC transporter ATP-binding protein [Gulosibacter molinativorax]QUY63600.1 ABC transporter transmembrane region family protein [Gulosibacter molinativorax]
MSENKSPKKSNAPVEEEFDEEAAAAAASAGAGMGDGSGDTRPAEHFWPSFKRLLGLLKPWAWVFGIATLLGIIWVILTVTAPKLLGEATNIIFEGVISSQMPEGATQQQVADGLRASGQEDFANMVEAMKNLVPGQGVDFYALSQMLLLTLGVYALANIFDWASGYLLNQVVVKAMFGLRRSVEEKIHRLPLSYFDRVKRGELLSRVTNDVDNITNALQQSLIYAITSLLTVIGVLVMMFSISWSLALVALVVLPITGGIFAVIGPRSQKNFAKQWKATGKLNSRVEESFSGHALVRVYGREDDIRERFATENNELYEASFKAQFLSGMMMPLMMFAGNLAYVGIAVLGGLQVASGQIRLGDVQAFIQYSQQFTQPLAQLGGMATTVQSATASAERVFELLDAEEEEPDADDAPELVPGPGRIEFKDVQFSYDPERELIRDLNFSVEPGQTVAIVGPTGAGKTTLVNLIMRFYELDGGAIELDGQVTGELRRHDVRARTGMVLQDPWLFQGSILENIRYGRQDASDDEVRAAAEATFVDRFVRQLPEGYETVLDEEASNVSAGEKQLITIARAFVADPAVLILDEATSSVDTRTELLLQHAMNALREGRTSFVIAHRLSTIRDADLILVMENGRIVEKGNHESLLAAEGAYWRLYQSQFAGAAVDLDAEEAALTGAVPVVTGAVGAAVAVEGGAAGAGSASGGPAGGGPAATGGVPTVPGAPGGPTTGPIPLPGGGSE